MCYWLDSIDSGLVQTVCGKYNPGVEWGEWRFKKHNIILFYKEFMTRGMQICYTGKVVS